MPNKCDVHTTAPPRFGQLTSFTRAWFWSVLIITAVVCLVWSHYRLFWSDELIEYYSDNKPTVHDVVWGQRHAPISFESPAFHVLLHFTHRLLPSAELASRFPSILALLVTESCVFFLTLGLSGDEAGAAVAVVLPFYLVTLDYGPEARVYSLLTACLAVALLAWRHAANGERRRPLALAALGLALGSAMVLHHYGMFLAVPVLIGEAVRSWQRRKIDWVLCGVILLALCTVIYDLSYARALTEVRQHYNDGFSGWDMVPFTYRWFMEHWLVYSHSRARMLFGQVIVLVAVYIALIAGARIAKNRRVGVWTEAAILAAFLLPVLNVAAAHVAHAYVPRYSLPAVVGVSVLAPIALFGRRTSPTPRYVAALLLLLFGLHFAIRQTYWAAKEKSRTMAEIQRVAAIPDMGNDHGEMLYFQDIAKFLVAYFYAPENLRAHLAGVYSPRCDLQWLRRDISSTTANNLRETTSLPFVPFSTIHNPGRPLLVLYHDGSEEWIDRELKAEDAPTEMLGKSFGGDLVRVSFPNASTCDDK